MADIRIVLQKLAGVFAALADAVAFVAVPRAAFLDQVLRYAQIDEVAFARDAFAVDDVELGFPERRCDLVLDDLYFGAIADYYFAFLDGGDAADVGANGGIEFQRAATRGGFGITKHHSDFFANLVDENQAGIRFRNVAGEFAHGLRHQARLQTHVAVTHFAVELGFRYQCRHGIHHQDVDGTRDNERAGDFERLLGVIGLRDQQVVHIHAELARVAWVERVLDIDERGHSAHFLRFGDDLQGDGCLAG